MADSNLTIGRPLNGTEVFRIDGSSQLVTSHMIASLADVGDVSSSSVIVSPGTTTRVLSDKLNEVLSVKDFGAVGDGVTDDTNAFIAARQAWKASARRNLAPNADGNKIGTLVIQIPPGAYLITKPQAMMDSSFTSRTYGMEWEGTVGGGQVQILYQPTTPGPLFYNNDAVLGLRFKNIWFNANSSTANFIYSNSSGGSQNYIFEDCVWDGTWGYGVQLVGTNNNSEMRWEKCYIWDNWTAFLASQTSDQFLNYWFTNCSVDTLNGYFIDMTMGGHVTITDCDFSGYAPTVSNILFNLLGNQHADGVMSFVCRGTRFELDNANALVMYCEWARGIVEFIDCDFSAQAAQSYSPTLLTHEFAYGNNQGPAVRFSSCQLVGQHEYISGSNAWSQGKSITYENCDNLNYEDFYAMFITSLASGSASGGLPLITPIKCRGQQNFWPAYTPWVASTVCAANTTVSSGDWVYNTVAGGTSGTTAPTGAGSIIDNTVTWVSQNIAQDIEYVVDGGLNGHLVTGAKNASKCAVFKTRNGAWPVRISASAPGATRLVLPPNAILTGIYMSLPAGVLSQASAGTYTVMTDQSSPTSFINFTSGGNLSAGFTTSWAGYYNTGTTFGTRSLIFEAATNVTQAAGHPAICYVTYILGE